MLTLNQGFKVVACSSHYKCLTQRLVEEVPVFVDVNGLRAISDTHLSLSSTLHFRFVSAGLNCLPCRVSQTFIAEGLEPLVAFPLFEYVCYNHLLIITTKNGNKKAQRRLPDMLLSACFVAVTLTPPVILCQD